MARVHRLGQTNKVMIYRLITRGTIEERMMQLTKKKIVLEHLVVGKLKNQNINQEELDDIIKYGSKDLFADENDEAGISRKIHYDDAAIDKLLDRDHVGDDEATLDDEDDHGILNAFKVANFEYIDDVKGAKEVAGKNAMENKSSVSGSERENYWEELLGDKYQEHKVEELNDLGKGKRSRNKSPGDGFASLKEDYSDSEAENYEANLSDDDSKSNLSGTTSNKKSSKRKSPVVDITERFPLMEGEGKSLRVLGFNLNQRIAFHQLMMRFGVGEYDWKEFAPRMKQKSCEEINDYGILFLTHIAEEITDSTTFSDGVPKEGLRVDDVLIRITTLEFIKEKVNFASENPGTPLFSDDILFRYVGLRGAKIWKQEHDLVLLRGILKHGYGKWHDILEDKDLKIQEVIFQELNLPPINFAVPGQVGSQAQNVANSPNVEPTWKQSLENGGGDMASGGTNTINVESACNQSRDIGDTEQGESDTKNQASLSHQKNWHRRQTDFMKRRVALLEKGLNAEYQKVHLGDANKVTNEEPKSEPKAPNVPSYVFGEPSTQMTNQRPQLQPTDVQGSG